MTDTPQQNSASPKALFLVGGAGIIWGLNMNTGLWMWVLVILGGLCILGGIVALFSGGDS